MIKIYDINDKLLMQAEVTSAAKREQEMSKSDYITLSFSAAEKVILPVGAYINYTYKIDKVREVTRKFLLLESYEPIQTDECSWKYTPQFQHPKMILSKTPFFIYTRNSQNVEVKQNVWSFVGTTSALSGKIADFLNKDLMFGECGWKVIFSNVTANTVNVSFSDNDFISALTAITNAIGDNCEWHIDYDDEFIYIGKVLVGATPVVLEVGKNVGVPNINNSKESYYNAFSIFGGTRNITQVNSKGENVSSGDIRLQLDEGNGTISIDGKERSYSIDKYSTLDLRVDKINEPLFTKVLDFSQIFPSLNTYVYNVRGRVKYVLDENNEKIPISYNADGSIKEYKTFTVWYMRLAYPTTEKVEGKTIINTTVDDGVTHYWYDFQITDNLLINGKNIGCSFEANFNTGALSTPLAGRGSNGEYVGFELTYHKEASSSHTSDDVSDSNFSVLAGDYEIIYQEDNEVIIPTNAADMLIPRGESMPSLKCNITVLYNIAMSDSIYYEDAQNRLLEKAKEGIVRLLSDLNNYEIKSYSDVFLEENPELQIGQSVTYKDGHGYELATRVLKLSTNIDFGFIQTITLGNQVIKGTITQLKEDVQTIIASGGSSGNGGGYSVSQLRNIIAKYGSDNFLSKQFDDTAKGTIIWEKVQKLLSGLLVGNFNSENGGSWTPDTEGRSHLITDYLEVRMKAIFEEIVVKKTSTIGGKEIISPAGGVVVHKVEEVTVTYKNVSQKAYRCYFLAEQEGDSVDNDFAVNDQVRSESFNVRKGTYHKVGNHFYWRLVIGRDEEPVELEGKKYHYIDLSDTDCATASDVPAKGDVLNQCGNTTDVERQNCLIFSAVDTYSPSISLYHGINSYSFANKEYVEYGVNKQNNKAFFNVYGDMYVGDRPTKENGYEGSSYIKYDSATKQVSVKGKISAKSTVDGKELSQYIKENSAKGLTEEQVNNLIKNSQVIADLQNQVDGAIETWFYEGVPTLTNAPASSWTSDKDKDTHLGDLYYDNKTGKAYRFAKDGNTYKWTIIADTDIAKALSDASKAQETADGKMKVFSAQPIPPYQLGDIWVNATYPTDGRIYKNEILRCQTAKAKGSSFAIADWTKASKYTDDSALNTFKEEYKNDMASYKEQLDEKVETWFYNYAPTTQNKPAFDWTTDTLKSQHAGDLFYNTSNGYTYRWTGTAWERIKDNDINTAMTAASKAQDTADGKRTVFTSQPTVPYDEGDLWASGGDDGKTLMVCIKSRTTGSFTSSEWVKANDSDLNAFAKTIEESLMGIQDQLDKKAETWYQSTDPSTSWTTDDAKKKHKGDLWYNTSNNQTFFWNGTKWDKQDVPTEVFDKIDGKSSIYVSKPASYEERDLWILEAAYTLGGVAYSKGELVVATKTNALFSAADWTKKVKYTDDTVANAAKAAAEKAQKAAETAQTNVTNLGKTVTSNKKAFDSYVSDGYLEPSEIAAMAQDSKRLEDAFAAAEKSYTEVKGAEVLKNTKELTDLNTAFTTLTTTKTELVTYLSDISARYNAADTKGKATIVSAVGTKFTNFQSAYSAFYDKLGLANAYITSKIYGDLKQNITDLAGYKYIKDALGQTTDIDGGLVMTTLLALRDADGNVQSGINGAIDPNRGKKSIATWWGGQMVDKDYNSGSLTPATSLIRFDGSGYLANGAIWWDVDGKVHADPTSFIISEKNLGAYLAFFEPTWKSGSNGTNIKDLVALTPQAPFTTLSVSNDLLVEGKLKLGSITLSVVNGALKIDGNVYSTCGMSAYGDGTNNGGGGGLVASVKSYTDIIKGTYTDNDLASIPNAYAIKALSNRIDNISSELGGLSLDWANITGKPSTFTPSAHTHKWVDITDRITKVSQLTNDSGYTTNKGTVTSVKLTLPTGLSLGTTKEITTSGTFAISLTSGYSIPTTSKQGQWDSAYNWYKLMTTDEETADGVINKWNEVVDFLAGIAQTDSLDSILSGINKSITDETNRAKKAEGANATNIATNKANITTLQGYFTNGSAKSAIKLTNARKLWGNSFDGTADISGSIVVPSGKYITIGNIKLEYDATNKALKITNTSTNEVANLYTSGGVSAYGVGTTSSGSTGGGGLNGTVKSYNDAKSLTSESLSEVASAYSVAALYSSINDAIGRINTLEGGSATSIEVTGSGNAVTGVSKSGTKLTFTKGATFLTSHQDISGKSDKTHTHSVKINGVTKTIAATGGTAVDLGTYLTSHQSLAAYLKSADAEKTYSKLGHTHAFSEITGKPTTLAGYGVTDGVNAVSVTGNGNAVTSASIDGHTLTLTKGSTFSLSGHTHTFASLTSKPTTIAGYGITDAYTKAQVDSTIAKYLPLAGGTITGALTVNGIATFKSKVAIGDIYIINDGSGNLYVQKTDGKTAANFYATGGITAFGASSVSGGTGSGLNGSVLGFEKATAMTSADNGDSSKTEVSFLATAWSIKQLNDKINAFGTGVFSDYLTIAAAKATYQPKGSYLTSHQTIYGLTIQKNGTSLGTYTPNSAAKTINVTVPTKLSELSNDSGYTKNTGTVTSVAISVPTGLSVSGSPITTNGTIAIALASGYSIPTTAKQTAWDGAVSAKHTHSNKSVLDGISSTKVSHWNSAYDWYALMTTDEETADGIINKWNEVVSFLANIAQTDTLSGIVDGINKSISDEVARAKKAEGVNASGISANKGSIATLQGYFTNGSAKKALQLTNARKLWGNSFNGTADINGSIIVPSGKYISIGNIKLEYDATNKALKITNTTTNEVANLYTSGGISAYGVGTSSSSGGGLNGSVKAYADSIKLTSENLSEIASAYSIAVLNNSLNAAIGRISTLEGGSATSIETTGSGNAVTSVSKSGTKITFTKGSTFSLNGHTHDFITVGANQTITATQYTKSRLSVRPYYNSGGPTTYGNILEVVSGISGGGQLGMEWSGSQTKTDGTDTNVGKLYYRSKRDNMAGWTVWKRLAFAEELAWGNISGKPTSLSGYGITDGVNAVSVTGSGNAITTASISGHTLTLTKGSTFSLSNHTHYVGTTRIQSSSAEQALTGITKIDNILKLSKASVTVNTSYKAEQNRLVIYGTTYGNDANYIKSAGKLSYGDGGPQLVFSTSENPDASGVQSAALVYTDHDKIGTGVSLSFVTNQGDAYFIAPHIKALTAFQGNLAWSYITNKPTTLSGFGITDAYTKAQVDSTIAKYLPLAGGTITGALTVNGIATFKSKVAIGDIYIINDGSGNLYVQKTDGKTAANFYATGGITAFGASSVSGGTGSGLNGSVLGFEKATAMTSADNGDSSKTEVSFLATAWSIKQLNDKINAFGTGVFSDYLTIAAAKATYQPKGSYLTSHQTIYGLTIQKNGTSLGTYTPNSAAKTINVTVPTKLSELSNDSGYTKNTGTVTSVAISVPTGLSVSGSPITTNGTIAIALASGYSIPTTAKQTAWDGAVSAKHTHSNKSVLDGISSTKVSHWNSAYDWYALMTTDEETADGIINKWNEVVSFLANIAQTDTLSGIVDGINKSISDEVARAKKAEGVNASGISANKGSIATLQGYFTNGSAKKALQLTNARKLWGNSFNGTADINGSIIVPSGKYISIGNIKLEYDATNKALKITNTTTNEVANLYTSGGISAYGVGTSSSSGGGLNGSVKAYADSIKLTSENLSEIASAYSIAVLNNSLNAAIGRISTLEGGSATSIETTGSGNAVTSVSKSGTKITFTKGSTFSLNGHTHDFITVGANQTITATQYTKSRLSVRPYYNSGGPTTYGNILEVVSGISGGGQLGMEWSGSQTKTDGTDTNVGKLYYRSKRDNMAGWTVWKRLAFAEELAWGNISGKPTSLSGYGITDGVNAVSVTGSGNAITTASISGHTLTLTKGSTFSLSNHTHYVGTTRIQSSSAEQALTGITKIDNILKLSKASVTVNTSYKAEQNRLVIYGTTYGNDANYIKSAGKLSYGDGGPQLVFSTSENPDASGVQSAALVYTDHDKIGTGVSLSFVTNQGDAYFIAPHIKALTAFQGNLAWSYITNKPTTLSGFGITDGLRSVTHPSGSNVFVTGISTSGTAITYTKSYTKKSLSAVGSSGWTNASTDGNIIPDMSFIAYWNGAYGGTSSNLAYCNKGAFGSFAIRNSLAFSELTSKPTTISGYGITDAYTKSQVDAIAAKYLPLTGGTLTGQLKIVASALNGAYNGLLIGDDCYIGDCNFANTIGLMGSVNSNAGMVKFGKGGMQFGYNGSNHIASTTAQWTNLNADLLDGWHKDNIVWSGAVNSNTANLSHYWAKLFDITVTDNLQDDRSFTFLFSNGYNDTYSVVVLRIRQNGAKGSGAYNFNIALRELVGNMSSRLRVYYNNATGNVQLWGNCQGRYGCLSYTIIKKTGRTSADFTSQGTLVTNTSFSAAQSLPATTGDSPYTLLDGATRIGIVKQADQLVTARSLWGQSFNGTANVSGNMTGVGNITMSNNSYLYGKNTGGTAIQLIAMASWNGVDIGRGALVYGYTTQVMGKTVVLTASNNSGENLKSVELSTAKLYSNVTIETEGGLLAHGGVTAYSSSDIRLKQDFRKLDYLGIIKAMGGTYGFAWKKDNTRSIGFIAQHVLCNPHLKDIVETDEKGYYKINYWSPKLIATAFGAIEQVGDEVSRLKARVVFLESEVQRLSGKQDSSDKKRLDNKNINLLN